MTYLSPFSYELLLKLTSTRRLSVIPMPICELSIIKAELIGFMRSAGMSVLEDSQAIARFPAPVGRDFAVY